MTPTLSLLIAGGGIGGLTTALALAHDGHAVTVLEQAANFCENGAGIQLGPNIFRMFDSLGLTEAVNRLSFFPTGLCMNDVRTGEQVVRVPLGDVTRASHGFPYGVINRADLCQVLLHACQALPGVSLRTDARLQSYDQSEDRVTVTLDSGEKVMGRALIGADGLWSKTREALLGDGKPRMSGQVAYRALLRREQVPAHLWSDDVTLWGGEKIHLVHYPLRRGELFNVVAVFQSEKYNESWDAFGDTTALRAHFSKACPQVTELLGKVETWKMSVLCDREPDRNWTDRRVTLLGDAAHPMLQYLAESAGQAIEDAVVLREALRFTRGDIAKAFQKYQQARYLRTGRVQLTARFYGDIYHASGVQRELRNQMFQSGIENAGFASLKWLYDGIRPSKLFQ